MSVRSKSPEYVWSEWQRLNARHPGIAGRYTRLLTDKLQKQPTDGQAWFALGIVRLVSGNSVEAVKAFAKASEHAPQDAHAFAYHGFALLEAGSPVSAVQSLTRAIELKPDFAYARWLLAQAHFRRGEHQQAARMLVSPPPGSDDVAGPLQ